MNKENIQAAKDGVDRRDSNQNQMESSVDTEDNIQVTNDATNVPINIPSTSTNIANCKDLNQNKIAPTDAENSKMKHKIYKALHEELDDIAAKDFLGIIHESEYDTEGILDDFDEDVESDIITTMIVRNKHFTKNQIFNIINSVINPKEKHTKVNKIVDRCDAIESKTIVLKNKYSFDIVKNEQYDAKTMWDDATTNNIVNSMIDKSSSLSIDQHLEKHIGNKTYPQLNCCSSHKRLVKLEQYFSNMILKLECSEVSNSNEYNDLEQNIEETIKQLMLYNVLDLISDEHHVKYCHNSDINITMNQNWMKLFTDDGNTICKKYVDTLNEYNVYHQCVVSDCFIYNRFKNLVNWLTIHGDYNNKSALELYLKEHCNYSLYDVKKDQNHTNFCHSEFYDQKVYQCIQGDDCCILSQLANARKHPNDYYYFNMMHGKWISVLAVSHKILCHSKQWLGK